MVKLSLFVGSDDLIMVGRECSFAVVVVYVFVFKIYLPSVTIYKGNSFMYVLQRFTMFYVYTTMMWK